MIRIVGYLVADASMPQATGRTDGWFTIYEAPPNLSAAQALDRCAARMRTWENRLRGGSYNGVSKVAVEATGPDFTGDGGVRVLEVRAREGRPS